MKQHPSVLHWLAGLTAFTLPLACVAILAFILYHHWQEDREPDANAQPRAITARGDLSEAEKANIAIYAQASPSLVQITNLTARKSVFDMDAHEVPKGVGSGFVWDENGYIVTNFHVVDGADAVRITLADHSVYEARQVWAYPDQDIAVAHINAPKEKLRPIMVGTSHDLKVGQIVYALGDPFGLDQTMTMGIVSALGRQLNSRTDRPINGVIQVSAAINPGNSGGPLLDSAGRLIGMNTAIVSPSGGFAGIGFAIPVDEINRVVPQLINHGAVVHPQLRVQLAEDELAQQMGVKEGALILKVLPNGPAAKAGLMGTRREKDGKIKLGDVILAIDSIPIKKGADVSAALNRFHVGDTVTLTIDRDGERMKVPVSL